MVEVGTTFKAYHADGRFEFTVVAVGKVGENEVVVAQMDDPYYGSVAKAFLVPEVQHNLKWSNV